MAVSLNGGSPVIVYQISYKTGAAAYSILAIGVPSLSYYARYLTLVGIKPDSSEVNIRQQHRSGHTNVGVVMTSPFDDLIVAND